MCTGPHPYIPVPNTAEVRWRFTTAGGVAENVFHFESEFALTGSDLLLIAEAAEDAWETEIADFVASSITLEETVVTDLSSATGGQVVNPGGISGGGASPVLPNNVTSAISFRTAQRGRSFRGRLFHVGLREDMVAGDALVPGMNDSLAAAYLAAMGLIGAVGPGFTHVVVSRCQEGAWLTTGETTPVIAYTVEPTIDSQRRRLSGRGM